MTRKDAVDVLSDLRRELTNIMPLVLRTPEAQVRALDYAIAELNAKENTQDIDEAKKKPPLGLEPRTVHDAKRAMDIEEAMRRYIEADMRIPVEWLNELQEIVGRCF